MSGAAIVAVFIVSAALMATRRLPALLAVPLMALGMAVVSGVALPELGAIVVGGAGALSNAYVAVIFGAWLGRVTIDTGIARGIVNVVAEFGGEEPLPVALGLCAIVAVLFVSLSGLGAIVMVGSIVLPILLTSGVPRRASATLFLMAFALGFIFNIANWTFYAKFFGIQEQQLIVYAVALGVIDAIALVVYAAVACREQEGYATWAVRADEEPSKHPPLPAYLAPVLPIVLYFGFHLEATVAFALSAIYAAALARPRAVAQTLVAAAIKGLEDVAPAVWLFMGIGMLLAASQTPQVAAALAPVVRAVPLKSPIVYVTLFGLLSPLALYRGPLNPFGVGIAVFGALLAAHAIPPIALVAGVMAVVQVQNVCDPTNTANVWVANYTGVTTDEIARRTLPYQVAVATLACVVAVAFAPRLFGAPAFGSAIAPARADTVAAPSAPPGMFVGPAGVDRMVVDDDGSPLARGAADAIAAQVSSVFPKLHAVRAHLDPNVRECSAKNYAGYAQVRATQFALHDGVDFDVGLLLEDCGGWEVDQWHEHRVYIVSNYLPYLGALGLADLQRMKRWSDANPVRSANLWSYGAAFAPGDRPTYYYSLFKPIDGYMHAFVRAGGPAYRDGLRTGDIVDKFDGKFWWEYGTYQTQSRAYDGKPHRFEVERRGHTLDIELTQPFAP